MSRHQATRLGLAVFMGSALGWSTGWSQISVDAVPSEPTILDRSPFIPPDWTPPQTVRNRAEKKPETTSYEFRGVYQLGDEYRFLVSEPRSRKGRWVQLGTAYEDYEVRGYDVETETLTLFYNSKEEPIQLAKVEANPTPMPVSGQIQKAKSSTREPRRVVRRTIRPSTRNRTTDSDSPGSPPPPPAWLQKLREEAAQRRAQASGGGAPGSAGSGDVTTQGDPGGPPPGPPPAPPQEILDMEIPPPPSQLPPEPPPEILNQILQSRSGNAPQG